MGNKAGISYAKAFLITAVIASLIFSVSLFIPNAYAKTAHVEPGGATNTSSTTIPQTTTTIPPSSAGGNSTVPGAPKINISVTYISGYTVQLNGTVKAGTNNTTISWLNVSWGDGVKSANVVLPINHTYPSTGTFLITATVFQSDNKTNSASVSADVNTGVNTTTLTSTSTILPTNTSVSTVASTSVAATTVAQSAGSSGSSNTLLYVGIVVVIIIILIIAWAMMGKKK